MDIGCGLSEPSVRRSTGLAQIAAYLGQVGEIRGEAIGRKAEITLIATSRFSSWILRMMNAILAHRFVYQLKRSGQYAELSITPAKDVGYWKPGNAYTPKQLSLDRGSAFHRCPGDASEAFFKQRLTSLDYLYALHDPQGISANKLHWRSSSKSPVR